MASQTTSLIGSVVEREVDPFKAPASSSRSPSSTGFPSVQHRSKSAFARAREAKRNNEQTGSSALSRKDAAPIVKRASTSQITEGRPEGRVKGVL